MVEVNLWSGLRAQAGGHETVEVEAKTVGDVLSALIEAHPALKPRIDAGVSVAVDGRIIVNSLTEPVSPNSEVFLLQKLRGG
ncbi:MAG: MoaD/ThiS family protein [Paracoccaceae bacterium]